jgi:sulfate permease, SulP family
VGIVALPLAIAFGIASGVTPEAGLFTAIIAGFLISALGGSRVQIGGPTGAFLVIVLGIVQQYGLQQLWICTVMAGFILLVLGFFRCGAVIKFIPYPVTAGFTNGIAVLIFSTQIADFLGLPVEKASREFLDRISAILVHLGDFQMTTAMLAFFSLGVMIFWPKNWARRVPGSIVAVVLTTLITRFGHLDTTTIGSRFGGIPQGLPKFQWIEIHFADLENLILPAITIALLAGIESLLSAVVADGVIDDRHDSNQELMAQGIANIVTPFFGGIPATGAIARTATNIRSGAKTPIAGIVHVATLLVILLAAAPLAKHIPLAALAAVLVMVSWNMGEWHEFKRLFRIPKSDACVFLSVFLLTVFLDLTIAVTVGMLIAGVLVLKRIADTTGVAEVHNRTAEGGKEETSQSIKSSQIPHGVMIYRISGAFLFTAADKLEVAVKGARQDLKVLILDVHRVFALDATGLNALESLLEKMQRRGGVLVISGPHTQPYMVLDKAGFLKELGSENLVPDLPTALLRAKSILGLQSQ